MASGPEVTEPLNYQTSILKVSIHCEGCKKKVRKVLQGLEGVYTIDIDSKQNKVTVTGIADAESLIRRLLRYGKHAQLWPEKKPTSAISSGATVGDAKVKTSANAETAAISAAAPKTEQKLQNTENKQQAEEGKTTPPQPTEIPATTPATATAAISGDVSASKPNIDASKSDSGAAVAKSDNQDVEKPEAAAVVGAASDASDEGNDEKKKGNKVQRETSSGDERAVSESDKTSDAAVAGVSPPPPMQFPPYAHPVYTLSYSAVQPSTSYAYYAASPAAMPSIYSYSGYPPSSAYPPENYSLDSYYGSMEAPAVSAGTYDMFNDENPNACNLM